MPRPEVVGGGGGGGRGGGGKTTCLLTMKSMPCDLGQEGKHHCFSSNNAFSLVKCKMFFLKI